MSSLINVCPHARVGRELLSRSVAIVGHGRMGQALHASLVEAGVTVYGPFQRDDVEAGAINKNTADVVLLAVSDSAISHVAGEIPVGPIIGHLSGATPLAALKPHESFVLHPLLTITGPSDRFQHAFSTVSASTDRALNAAQSLAEQLGMRHVSLKESDRAAYHAAASASSNFVMTVLGFAEDLANRTGISREMLAPLVQASVDNWVSTGARQALTGPIARGDEVTVARQRSAVETMLPTHLALFDALVVATQDLADSR